MNRDTFHFLRSPAGTNLLAELSQLTITPHNHLQIAEQLRHRLAPALAQAAIETALLRQQAQAKFSRAGQMFFTRPGLEQASSETIANYRAGRFAGLGWVADLCCGLGGDALALAAHCQVVGLDLDPLRLWLAQANVAAYNRESRFQAVQADLLMLPPLAGKIEALFFDPGRRDERGKRIYDPRAYRPPLGLLARWRQTIPQAAAKVSPAIDDRFVPAGAEIEFISLNGELKECLLWFGDLRSGVGRRATLLPAGASLSDEGENGERLALVRPGAYLYEPDGAVIRAHLVEKLGRQLAAGKIDPDIAYLTADQPHLTPFARCFAIEDALPFQLKRLRAYLRQRHIGHVTIKKRGSPLEPEALRQQLQLTGDQEATLFLTHVHGRPFVLIGRPHT